jgi:hypothetical protein
MDVPDDHWHIKFREKAGPRLRVIFETDAGETPDCLTEKLEELRRQERQLLRKKKKLIRLRDQVR